ncbi:DUF2157 domain-containing protein [Thiolinea disciformis]|uniref:DUF2157 domain-containing protein n=1 Tax=Thiolinea disciformis TaxID=125614 RepID=UPI0003606B9C|nr:DUF2157 domain-containing protein [Thiolinea disciformis]
MAGIDKKLALWEQNGLITPDQVDEILAFENGDNASPNNWWLYSLLVLGSAIIGLGVISLIAANWANIPDSVKLAADFLLLGSTAAAIIWQYDKTSGHWFDALIMIFLILCLATIGLIAQIYHIHGQWYHGLLLWSVITFPLTIFSRNVFVRFFWVSLFLHGFVWSCIAFADQGLGKNFQAMPAIFLFAPLAAAFFYLLTQRIKPITHFASSFYFWFEVAGLVALIAIDLIRSGGDDQTFNIAWYIPSWLVAALVIGLIVTRNDYSLLNKALLISALVLLLFYYQPNILFSGHTRYTFAALDAVQPVSLWMADDVRAPLLTTLILFLYAIHAGNCGHHRTFNMITFLIGLRFVVLYFQAMGGLAATGIGLIVSGLMIIGIAWFWYSSRERLQNWSKRLAS